MLALVLHAHLPFVRHPEHEESVEERWLFEATLECYLPLVGVLRRLARDRVPARLTLSMTPPLVDMLQDDLLRARTTRHLDRLVDLASRESREAPDDERGVAAFYLERLGEMRTLWEAIGQDVPGAFAALAREGLVEILGSAATHAFLPLLAADGANGLAAVRAQMEVGLASHARVFGARPPGVWLPECGWDPCLDGLLADVGVDHVVLETHGVLHATPRPVDGVHAPIRSPAGVAAFARDPDASWQVWSADHGYPGDPSYRDFYRDVGYERAPEALGALAHPAQVRLPTGLKYRRVGDKRGDTPVYDPGAARARTRDHAAHFLWSRAEAVRAAAPAMDREPLVVAPYDAELFGHWWFEGPDFLEEVLRGAASHPETRTTTLAGYLEDHRTLQSAMPSASSWGEGGYSHVWCNEKNAWMWPEVRAVTSRMLGAARLATPGDVERRALAQAAREVLLAQSSDWPFLVYTATAGNYPVERFQTHLARAHRLLDGVERGDVDAAWLADIESRDDLFDPTLARTAFLAPRS